MICDNNRENVETFYSFLTIPTRDVSRHGSFTCLAVVYDKTLKAMVSNGATLFEIARFATLI